MTPEDTTDEIIRALAAIAAEPALDQTARADAFAHVQHRYGRNLVAAAIKQLQRPARPPQSPLPPGAPPSASLPAPSPASTSLPQDAPHQGITASEGGVVDNARQYINHGGTLTIIEGGRAPRSEIATYLENLVGTCTTVTLGPLAPSGDHHDYPMPLEKVYIPLYVDTPGQTLGKILGQSGQRRIVILGEPGSGKSTLINYVVLCLAQAYLAEVARDKERAAEWLTQLQPWQGQGYIPVRIILREFAAYIDNEKVHSGSTQLLLNYLQHDLAARGCPGAFGELKAALSEGRAILLFDGFDEVIGNIVVQGVVSSIGAIATSHAACPIVVTSRARDYDTDDQRRLPRFVIRRLLDLDDTQIKLFVTRRYAEMATYGNLSSAMAGTRVMLQALAVRPELQQMARLPLLLTVITLVHASKGVLPESRALLYRECVDLLLYRWRQPENLREVLQRLHIGDTPDYGDKLLFLVARLGFRAHELSDREVNEPHSRSADIPEHVGVRELAKSVQKDQSPHKYATAEVLFQNLQGNGLLIAAGNDNYRFSHRSLQEFLAGYYLLHQPEYLKLCLQYSPKAHWQEVLRIMVSYQVLALGEIEKPLVLAEKLSQRSVREIILAGEILTLIGHQKILAYDSEWFSSTGSGAQIRSRLLQSVVESSDLAVTSALRMQASLTLGHLCYGQLTSLCEPEPLIPLPDLRFPLTVIKIAYQRTREWQAALSHYWLRIEPGPVWHQPEDSQQGLREVNLPYRFHIARFPITNADFARFIAGGGYEDAQWWLQSCKRSLSESMDRFSFSAV